MNSISSTAEPKLFYRRNVLTMLLLVVVAWIFYLPTLRYGFVHYDDVRILQDHPELYGQTNLSTDLKEIFATSFPREEPLLVRDVSWAVDSRIFGFGNPLGYHLDNVLLHGLVVALLFAFLFVTTRRYNFALATAAAFLILAVHTEPVAWIMGRKDILSALFMLLALCAQTRRLAAPHKSAQIIWHLLVILFFFLALLSKINVLTFPLVLLLHAIFFPYLRGEKSPSAPLPWKNAFREGLLFLPCMAISGLVFVWYQRILSQMGIFERGYTARGLEHSWNLLMVDPLVFWTYLRQIFFPSHLTVLYTWPALNISYPVWQITAAFATVIAITGFGIYLFRRRKDVFFFYAAFFGLMIPYANLIFVGIWVAERYVYFSSACILAVAISFVADFLRNSKKVLRIGAMAVAAIFFVVNVTQKISYELNWRDGETLWKYHVALPHPSYIAYENLAAYYYAQFTDAFARNDSATEVSSMRKMEIVLDAGFAEFWRDHSQPPPPQTAYLFFLKSLTQQVKGEPRAALDSLLTSDRINPKFNATKLHLSQLYRQLADDAKTPAERAKDFQAARDWFEQYIQLEFRARPVPTDVQKDLDDLNIGFEKSNPPEK